MAQEGLPQTSVEVCSRAMVIVGLRPMTSFSEVDRDEVIVASSLYEITVMEMMSAYPWKFCAGQQQLENNPATPLDRYETAWHVPKAPTGQPYQIHTVRVGDEPVVYEIMEENVYCNAGAEEEVIAHYNYRVSESQWPPTFALAVIFRMATLFASAITRKDAQIKAMSGSYQMQINLAKTRDSQSVTVKRLRQDRFSRFRRGGGAPDVRGS